MVVLEGGGMLTSGSNQYLQPDYLSPLPTTLDAKKSPLALLAQTCSQIGADSPSTKPLIPPLEKAKKPSSGSAGAVAAAADSPAQSPAATKRSSPASAGGASLAFKPYEANVLTKKADVSVVDTRPPSSKAASANDSAGADEHRKSVSSRAPSRKSASPPSASAGASPDKAASTPSTSGVATSTTPSAGGDRGKSASPSASPIIRSGLEILHGHPKDLPLGTYKAGALSSGLAGLCTGCPPGLEPTNPAFRPPFAGGPFTSHQHAAATAAMLAAGGYPSPAAPGPYVSYARVKTASGGEALVPVCKDPYCTGCQYSSAAAAAAAAAAHQQLLLCPSGCTQCDHHKYGLAALSAGLVPPLPYARPYVCNWIVGETYCGKRFTTSDELLQHLRTHTSLASAAGDGAASAAAAAAAAAASMSLLGGAGAASPFLPHRYPNPPLSPLSARYHPYSKPTAGPGASSAAPGALPGSLGASPFSAFNPAGLGPYYSPYALYGQRIGAAAVHP
ncbi:zinc finger protein Noc [Schistocerca americana]|uniref:zinc finger protein Noc n=1 Tax=Schistocerca americana TaxID=7009 RepID=UPI001F4FDBE6|nr:zinc finger protein Noc [Schistocerca americana]XP_049960745.1 zinc finger protein Noc [Schistocerca serialis cubense]